MPGMSGARNTAPNQGLPRLDWTSTRAQTAIAENAAGI